MTTASLPATSGSTDNSRPLDAVASRERTPWLLGILCVLIPILPTVSVPPGPLKSNGSPARVIAVLFFGLALLGFVLIRRTASTRTVRPGVLIILLYFLLQLAIYGVGITRAGSELVEGQRTRAVINLVATAGVALYIIVRIQTSRERDIVLGCLLAGLTFACLVGMLQALTQIDLRYLFHPPGFVLNNMASETLQLDERYGAKRVVGTSQHSIEFSVLAAVTVPLAIYFARNAARRSVRLTAGLALVLGLVSMPAAVSRTGVIALAAALLVYLWAFKVREFAVGVLAGSLAVGAYIATFAPTANALWNTIIHSEEDISVTTRTADYAAVSKTFRENPIFGLGLGGTPPTEYMYLDNEWLQALVQGGIVGFAAMILLAGGGILGIAAALRGAATRRERERAYVLGSIFVAILACSFTFDLFSFQQATLIFFIIFGLLWSNFAVPLPPARTTPLGS